MTCCDKFFYFFNLIYSPSFSVVWLISINVSIDLQSSSLRWTTLAMKGADNFLVQALVGMKHLCLIGLPSRVSIAVNCLRFDTLCFTHFVTNRVNSPTFHPRCRYVLVGWTKVLFSRSMKSDNSVMRLYRHHTLEMCSMIISLSAP